MDFVRLAETKRRMHGRTDRETLLVEQLFRFCQKIKVHATHCALQRQQTAFWLTFDWLADTLSWQQQRSFKAVASFCCLKTCWHATWPSFDDLVFPPFCLIYIRYTRNIWGLFCMPWRNRALNLGWLWKKGWLVYVTFKKWKICFSFYYVILQDFNFFILG